MNDPYQVLGVDRSATADEIKAAFRQLAMKHHPDRNADDPRAAQRFKELNAAYQVLGDPQKRAAFDRFGGKGGPGGPFRGGVSVDFADLNLDGFFGEILDALGIKVGDRGDIQTELSLSFEEAAFGAKKTIRYDRVAHCEDCGGGGAQPGTRTRTCGACQGRGKTRQVQGVFPIPIDRPCTACGARGRVPETPCRDCAGTGLRRKQEELEVDVPPGVDNGAAKRIDGMGHRVRNKRAGGLTVTFRVKPHPFFRRAGDDVVCTLPITFAQAALGDEVEIPTLDGKGRMRIPAGTQPGTSLRIRGKGIPKRLVGGRGDQLVDVHVEIPTALTDAQKAMVERLAEELGESVQPQRRTFADKLKDLFS
ncbi:MAG: J domain-containing protein [Myxococcota bacterium]